MSEKPQVRVTVTGPKYSGKTTISRVIGEALLDAGFNVTVTDDVGVIHKNTLRNHRIASLLAPDDRQVSVVTLEM